MFKLRLIAALLLAFNSTLFASPASALEVAQTVTVVSVEGDLTTAVTVVSTAETTLTTVSQTLNGVETTASRLVPTAAVTDALSVANTSVTTATTAIADAQSAITIAQDKIVIANDATIALTTTQTDLSTAQANLDAATAVLASATSAVSAQELTVTTALQNVAAAQAAIDQAMALTNGVTAVVYNNYGWNNAPPLPSDTQIVGQTTVPQIAFNWGSGRVLGGPSEDVVVKFTGTLTSPVSGTVGFYGPADDGFKLILNDTTVINDWYDKGGGGSYQTYQMTAGQPVRLTAWYYENGGGANVYLYWNIGNGLQLIPASAFTTGQVDPTLLANLSAANETLSASQAELAVLQQQQADSLLVVTDKQATVVLATDSVTNAQLVSDQATAEAVSAVTSANSLADIASQLVSQANSNVVMVSIVVDAEVINQRPKPTPSPTQTIEPVNPTPTPTIEPTPEPTTTQEPVEPTPEPTVSPTGEPTPSPEATTEPTEEPTPPVVDPSPAPEPSSPAEAIAELTGIAPEDLTDAQVEQLVQVAYLALETAEPGSPEYEQALGALAVAAKADDPELPQELAAIPLLGDVAGAALEFFNNIGNFGADMSPKQREKAEETVVGAVIVGQVAQMASAAAAAAGATAASSSSASTRKIK